MAAHGAAPQTPGSTSRAVEDFSNFLKKGLVTLAGLSACSVVTAICLAQNGQALTKGESL